MIPAAEALRLPSAQLTEEERTAADTLESEIDTYVRSHMERRGCDLRTSETNNNVIAEVSQRLKAAGYLPQWGKLAEVSPVTGVQRHVGYLLMLAPSDEAYQAAVSRGAA